MKKSFLLSLVALVYATCLLGQNSGKGFNFQAVARNNDGSVKQEQNVQLTISIYPSSERAAVLYSETASVTTDKFGVFSLVVGKGTPLGTPAPVFEEIDFSAVNAYLNVILHDGVNNIEIVHAPLLSVPYAESAVQADNGMPVGAILPYAGEVMDSNSDITVYGCKGTWRLCNGAEYDPSEFVWLHMVLNDAWGTNRLPDLRGVFLRGSNYGASDNFKDPDAGARVKRGTGETAGNVVGSFQTDAFRSHSHPFNDKFNGTETVGENGGLVSGEGAGSDTYTSENKNTSQTGGSETRPMNAAVSFIIRVK